MESLACISTREKIPSSSAPVQSRKTERRVREERRGNSASGPEELATKQWLVGGERVSGRRRGAAWQREAARKGEVTEKREVVRKGEVTKKRKVVRKGEVTKKREVVRKMTVKR